MHVQSCLTFCDPMDCSLPGSSVHGISQARILEWVAFSSTGDLPNPGSKPRSPTLQVDSLPAEPQEPPANKYFSRLSKRRRQWQPTPVLLPGKSHGRRSLVGYSSWGCNESDTTERLHYQRQNSLKLTEHFRIYFTKNFSCRQAPSGVEGVCTYAVFCNLP